MSRFIDKLTCMRKNEPQPIGFMLGRKAPEKPRMQLIAYVTADNLDKVADSISSADAVLVEVNKADEVSALEKACQAKEGPPSGGWIRASNGSTLKKALNAGCDFLAFPTTAPVTATRNEKSGRVLELDTALSDVLLRTASEMPIDAVLAFSKGEDNDLTIDRLMNLQRLTYLVAKPLMVFIPANLTEAELQSIWDIAICGVVVEVADEKSAGKLTDLKNAIDKLGPPACRKKSRGAAIIPRVQPEPEQPEEGEEEEDE